MGPRANVADRAACRRAGADCLRSLARATGIPSALELAHATGLSPTTTAALWNGVTSPGPTTAPAVARALGVEVETVRSWYERPAVRPAAKPVHAPGSIEAIRWTEP